MSLFLATWPQRALAAFDGLTPTPTPGRMRHGLIHALALAVCVWFPLQDLVLAVLYGHGVPAAAIRGMLVLKEALVVLMLGGAALRWTLGTELRVNAVDLMGLLYAGLLTAYLLVGDAELSPRLAQYRSLGLPVLLYLAGRALPPTEDALRSWVRWTVSLAVLVAASGFVERFALGIDFWRGAVRLGPFLVDIKGQVAHMVHGLPGNMFGDYGFGYFQFRRLSGVFGSPLTMGYYLVFPILLLFGLRLRTQRAAVADPSDHEPADVLYGPVQTLVWIGLLSVALLLTVTRGGVGAVLIAVALALLLYRKVRLLIVTLIFSLGVFVAFEDYLIKMVYNTLIFNDSSTVGHYLFLRDSIAVVMDAPMGLGIGAAGGWAHTMSKNFSGAAENAYLVIAAQAGLYAVGLFLAFCGIAWKSVRAAEQMAQSQLLAGFLASVCLATVAYLVTGILSEQILTFTSIAHYWMSLGYAVTLAQRVNDEQRRAASSEP